MNKNIHVYHLSAIFSFNFLKDIEMYAMLCAMNGPL